jgi:hypothetical protein
LPVVPVVDVLVLVVPVNPPLPLVREPPVPVVVAVVAVVLVDVALVVVVVLGAPPAPGPDVVPPSAPPAPTVTLDVVVPGVPDTRSSKELASSSSAWAQAPECARRAQPTKPRAKTRRIFIAYVSKNSRLQGKKAQAHTERAMCAGVRRSANTPSFAFLPRAS